MPVILISVPTPMVQMATVAICQRLGSPTPKTCSKNPLAAYDSVPRASVSPHMYAHAAAKPHVVPRTWRDHWYTLPAYGHRDANSPKTAATSSCPTRTIGKAQKNFGPAANSPRVKIAYTAAIGDTSANANDSADRKLKPRSSCGGGGALDAFVYKQFVVPASHGVRH